MTTITPTATTRLIEMIIIAGVSVSFSETEEEDEDNEDEDTESWMSDIEELIRLPFER